MKKIIYFSHVPKTAGTTFSSILKQNSRSRYLYLSNPFAEPPLQQRELEHHLDKSPEIMAIGGHRISFDVPYDYENRLVYCVAFLRNPILRLESAFYYRKRLGMPDIALKCKTIDDYVSALEDNRESHEWMRNMQHQYLTIPKERLTALSDKMRILLLPTEKFNRSLFLLNRVIPEIKDVSYIHHNRNNQNKRRISDDLAERIRALSWKDEELYSFCCSSFEKHWETLDLSKDFQSFESRLRVACKLRKWLLKPSSNITQKISNAINSLPTLMKGA